MRATRNLTTSLALCAMLAYGTSGAQSYPRKPIRMIEPVVSGSPLDVSMRRMIPKLTEFLGQPVVVENRPGGNSAIGAREVARAAPDGYVLLHANANNSINDALEPSSGTRLNRELSPVTLILKTPLVMTVHPSLQAGTLKDYISLARAKPGTITYASGGPGSLPRLLVERMHQVGGMPTFEVPYKSPGAEMPDLVAGNLMTAYVSPLSIVQHVRAGRLRALALSGARRIAILPEVPTMAEAGLPGVEATAWTGVCAPAGTPGEVILQLQKTFARVLALPEIREEIEGLGQEPAGNTPEEFGAFIRAEVEKWTQVVRAMPRRE